MAPSYIGNRDPRLGSLLHDPKLLVDGIPSTALNTRINLNMLCIRRHSRMTRLTPSSYLRQTCPVEMGAAPAGEKAQMLEELWSDPAGKSYPPLITEKSQNIDLSDYSHEMMSLGAASIRWEIQKGGKDISSKNAELLDSLQRMSDEEVDMFLEDNSWEIDLQYYLIESVASVA